MTNNEIIFETVRNTFTPAQLAELVQATYTAEQIAARRANITITVDEGSAATAEDIFTAMLAADQFHTFAEWKRMGYSVKKGAKSAITCQLWKYTDKPGKAAREAAEAAVEVAKANVATTQLTVDSKTELHAQNIISDYDLQTAKNSLASAKAALAQAEAQLASARNDLSYTTITSPSDGVVGTIPFRVGSLVGTTTQEPLTVVSDINKMFVYFSMNEKQLLALTRQKDGSVNSMIGAMPEVQLQLADGTMYPAKGKIETLSGVIDLSTGAVQMRATFPNAQRLLRSGGTGTVLIPSVLDSALLIPQSATYEVQDKKFVYVLGDSSKVKNTEITVFPLDNGKQYVVTSGLKPGEQVVVEGVATLRDGMPIQPITPEQSAAKVQAMTQQMQQAAAAQK